MPYDIATSSKDEDGASLEGHYATYIVGNVFNPKISWGKIGILMMLHIPRNEYEVSDSIHVFK